MSKKGKEVTNIDQIIEEQLRVGKTQKEIYSNTGYSLAYIQNLKKQLIEAGKLSEEEIETARKESKKTAFISDAKNQKILSYAKQGLSQNDIAYEIESTQTRISRILATFKEYGIITQQEIDEARARYNQEIKYDDLRRDVVAKALLEGRLKSDFAHEAGVTERGAKVIQDSLIEEGRITQEQIDMAVATKGKEVIRRQKILELLKQGYFYQEISEIDGYGPITIRRIKEKAISDGLFTEEEYQEARKKRSSSQKKASKKSKNEDEKFESDILQMLLKGKDMFYLRRKTGQSKANISGIIKKLVKSGKISEEQIKEARYFAGQELERKVLLGLRKGQTQREIVASFGEGEYTLAVIQTTITNLKAKRKITDEEIEKYKDEAKHGKKELQEFILNGVRQGLSISQMAELDETGCFSASKIKHTRNSMRKKGLISKRDIEKGKKAKKRNTDIKLKQKRNEFYESVLKLAKQGYTLQEIADKLGYKNETIRTKISDLKKQGKITQEEIDKARREKTNSNGQVPNVVYTKYKDSLSLVQKIYKADTLPSDDRISSVVQEWLEYANKLVGGDAIRGEDIKLVFDLVLQARNPALGNILGISQLHVKMANYQNAVYTLNYSRSFLKEEKELKTIDKALGAIALYKRKAEAIDMLHQKYPLEVIQQRTKLGTSEIVDLQNKVQVLKNTDIIFPEFCE